ncbi:MAG: 50S ribosomal protein L17 [Thermodesulfobacteriota bacterium]
MKHNRDIKRFNMRTGHFKATMNNMAASLIIHERIKTTIPRAKELRRVVEKLITLGKRGDLHARRQAAVSLKDRTIVKKLFDDIAPRYGQREGGYTRIMRFGHRRGDGVPIAIIELVEEKRISKEEGKGKPPKKAKKEKVKPPKTKKIEDVVKEGEG